jgi:predicted TIM-barrel fold metal-dependent hydrolase
MIVDVHTHTPTHSGPVPKDEEEWNTLGRPDGAVRVSCSWDEHDQAMAEAGVDIAIVFTIATWRPGLDATSFNDSTADFVAAAPKRRIGFMSVHPHDPQVLDEMDRCVTVLGLKGIKLGPNYQNFDPLGTEAERVLDHAERLALPIVFHQGTSPVREAPLRYAHPLVMDEIAIRHPELRIVMAHMGHPWQADTIAVIRKHPHVYADVSALFYRPWSFWSGMRLATEWNVLHKLVLGSDWPIIKPAETIAGLRRVNDVVAGTGLPRVPEQAIEDIIQRDALNILGVKRP